MTDTFEPGTIYIEDLEIGMERSLMIALLLIISVSYMVAGGYSPFLYFNF